MPHTPLTSVSWQKVCAERHIALQTIKGYHARSRGVRKEHTTTTWYEPLHGADATSIPPWAMCFPFQGAFLNTASDMTGLLPKVIDAAQRWDGNAPASERCRCAHRAGRHGAAVCL